MQLHIDTADLELIRPLMATGLFTGITTNPTIIRRGGITDENRAEWLAEAFDAGAEIIWQQTWGRSLEELTRNAEWLMGLDERVALKVPATRDGYTLAARVSSTGHPVLLTATYSPTQIAMAAAAGIPYCAPYLGRLNDTGADGLKVIEKMQEVLLGSGSMTELIVASIRELDDIADLAALGVGHVTIGEKVLKILFDNDLTAEAIDVFTKDAYGE
ncbi:transaldolase family protein [Enemella sp. A6]|uniref:transaldolase family protein n=1 Tax=Enemella sp. A6 TaxID=3440152 RepID=UPI003EBCF668